MLIFYLHAWCKGSIFKKQVCILGSGVSLKIGIRFLKHQTHPKMRWDLSLKCSAVSRKVGFFIHFFTMGQNFQIQKTVEKCHTLKISTLPKFWISTSVVADGQFQTCTVQTWGCDWSGFKKDPLQDAERAFGWEAIFAEGSSTSLFGIVIVPGFNFFVDMIFIYIPCTLGHWDIGYSLI